MQGRRLSSIGRSERRRQADSCVPSSDHRPCAGLAIDKPFIALVEGAISVIESPVSADENTYVIMAVVVPVAREGKSGG